MVYAIYIQSSVLVLFNCFFPFLMWSTTFIQLQSIFPMNGDHTNWRIRLNLCNIMYIYKSIHMYVVHIPLYLPIFFLSSCSNQYCIEPCTLLIVLCVYLCTSGLFRERINLPVCNWFISLIEHDVVMLISIDLWTIYIYIIYIDDDDVIVHALHLLTRHLT